MAIKWQDIKVGASPFTGQIYIGKVKNNRWTDRSGDMTTEVILAVVEKAMIEDDQSVSVRVGNKEYRLKLTVTKDEENKEEKEKEKED